MRFIRQEEIITTICNTEVTEGEHIVRLFSKLKEEGVYFSLAIKKTCYSDYSERIISYSKAKVNNIDEENYTVDFYIYKETSLIKMNKVSFDDISEVFALTIKNNLLEMSKGKGIFDYIDLVE